MVGSQEARVSGACRLTTGSLLRHNVHGFAGRRDDSPAPTRKAAMPLLDHFHPPLSAERRWESFYSSWATKPADALTKRWLPPNYIAEEHAHFGPSVEIDVAAFEREATGSQEEGTVAMATVGTKGWAPRPAGGV